jgi:UDP:flavonoid glycosyltransferase YjiC (YdhE family)
MKLVRHTTYNEPDSDVSGFFFYPQPSYQPPSSLAKFLESGPPPVYIGFGSIVIDNPTNLIHILLSTISRLNIRALISKGWGGLSAPSTSSNIYFLGNCPHDWLFPRVQAVVHHGGAGTTAIGLKCGKPTVVVSFFGDQMFWGEMCARAGAGPSPIPYKELSVERLVEGIKVALSPEAQRAATELSLKIGEEDGVRTAVDGFHRLLPLKRMRCAFLPEKVAVWRVPKLDVGISSVVAGVLDKERKLDLKKLGLSRHKIYDTENQPVISSGVMAYN